MNEHHLRNWIIAALRRASYRFPPRYKAKAAAKIGRNQYKCELCSGVFGNKEVQLDHIIPVVALEGFDSWDGFIDRLFCSQAGFQVVCKPCHKEKTQGENKKRRDIRNNSVYLGDSGRKVSKPKARRRKSSGASCKGKRKGKRK